MSARVVSAALSAALLCAAVLPFFVPLSGSARVYAETLPVQREARRDYENVVFVPLETARASEAKDAGCADYDAEIEAIARTMWGEARGVGSTTEIAAVGWCILNRVDSPDFPDTVLEVVAQPKQFQGYSPAYPVTDRLRGLAADVLTRWRNEREGEEDVGRVLPSDYCFFLGDGRHNYFTTEFLGSDVWEWELPSPYED